MSLPNAAEAIALAAEFRRRGQLDHADEALGMGFIDLVRGLSNEQLERLLASVRVEMSRRFADERDRALRE